jgi:hypothetical protein
MPVIISSRGAGRNNVGAENKKWLGNVSYKEKASNGGARRVGFAAG